MRFNGVFFDLYGTLLIYSDISTAWSDWLAALYEGLKEHGLSISETSLATRCDGFFGRPEPPSQDRELTVLERRIRALAVQLELAVGSRAIQAIADRCVNAWQRQMSLDPDAISVLQVLKTKRTLALISNFDHPSHVYSLLSELGIANLFEAVVVSGDVGVKKPDPEIFSMALRQTKLRPYEVAYVGDTSEDVQGASAAGLWPVLIRRGPAAASPPIKDFVAGRPASQETVEEPSVDATEQISELSELVELLL